MKNSVFALSIVLLFLTMGCKKATFGTNSRHVFSEGNSAIFDDGHIAFSIRFAQLLEDSRCPPDVFCFHGGRIIVRLLIDGEKIIDLGLLTNAFPSFFDYKGKMIHFKGLDYKKDKPLGYKNHPIITVKVE